MWGNSTGGQPESWWQTAVKHPQTRSLVPVHSGAPPGFVVWKAAAPPGLTPGAGPPPLIATLIEPVSGWACPQLFRFRTRTGTM